MLAGSSQTQHNSPQEPFQPFVAAESSMAEFTLRAVVMGTLLGMIFGASSLYLVLKVGLTVSASIPVAVIAITLFRLMSKMGLKDSTILENNIVQTAGSAGESIAFGLGVTMPAILILGFDLEITRVALVAVLGGLLGIFMMIPLRKTLIVARHGELKYPEGTACAEVLKVAEASKASTSKTDVASGASVIFLGFAVGLAYKATNIALKGWKDVPEKVFGAPLKGGSVGVEISPELLGVGYIIGPRIASIMAAGGVMAYLLLIPLIKFFGDALSVAIAPGTKLISEMSPNDIRSAYVLYIGAGAVAAGGIVSMAKAMPTIWNSLKDSFKGIGGSAATGTKRTDQDISMKWVLVGCLAIVVIIMLAAPLNMNLLGAIMILVFGFLFATVSSQLTGQIGSSSNPISGMTVATLLFVCLIFLLVGWTGGPYYVTALSVGAIVCIASSNAGTTSQDLKTGYLVGATPRLQQYSILVGALASAVMLGPILLKLNDAATVYVPVTQIAPAGITTDASKLTETATLQGVQALGDSKTYRVWHKTDAATGLAEKYLVDDAGNAVWLVDPGINGKYNTRPDGSEVRKYDAPKALLMSYIIKGILDQKLPWALVMFGVMIALILEMCGVASLPFAVGVYLPLSSSAPIFVGGMVRWLVDRRRNKQPEYANASEEERTAAGDRSPGVLLSSGYIAGGALAGIIIAFSAGVLSDFDKAMNDWAVQSNPFFAGPNSDMLSMLPYAFLVVLLYWFGREKAKGNRNNESEVGTRQL